MTATVIIGAARGIGRAIAEDSARSDPKRQVVVADIDAAGVERFAAELVRDGVMRPRILTGKVALASEVAAVVTFLLCPASSHMVLADLVVDGGERLGM